MPYIITLKEPIVGGLDYLKMHQIFDIRTERINVDIAGLLGYAVNGVLNYIPFSNVLGTYYVKEGQPNE